MRKGAKHRVNDYTEFMRKLRSLMGEANLTNVAFSEQIGMDQGTLGRKLRGIVKEVTLLQFVAMVRALKLTPQQVYEWLMLLPDKTAELREEAANV